MRFACLIYVLSCIFGLNAQTARPEFRADRVIPSFGDMPLMLAPGTLVSIYGNHLGPAEGCRGYGDQRHWETLEPDNPFHIWERIAIYPEQLCGVQVKIGDIPAGLLWVQGDQINFQVPTQVPFEGGAELRVIRNNTVSEPVSLTFGLERMTLTQDEPAYVGMPVWIRVHTDQDLGSPVLYPFHSDPIWFTCEQWEVRRNGVPLPRIAPKSGMLIGSIGGGNICRDIQVNGNTAGRLPIHMAYRLDEPGTYEVRFTRMRGDAKTIRDRSAWTRIEILPATTNQRVEWLGKVIASKPNDAAELLSDYLPSVLGYGDAATLPLVVECLYHPDHDVQEFVMNSLADYYDKVALMIALRDAVRREGSNEGIEGFLERLAHSR